jgi:hypothetical protein
MLEHMRHNGNIWVCILGSLVLCARAEPTAANPSGNPYQSIVERNVFGLKEPPPPAPTEPVKPPPPKITLTGIITMGGKRALLSTPPVPARTAAEARAQYFTLAEGQRDGELEVLEINERARTVKVSYGGTVETLDFNENGVKPAPAAQVGMAAAIPQIVGRTVVPAGQPLPATQFSQVAPDQQAMPAFTPVRIAPGNIIPGTWRRSMQPTWPR